MRKDRYNRKRCHKCWGRGAVAGHATCPDCKGKGYKIIDEGSAD